MKYNKIALGFLGLVSGILSFYLPLKWSNVFDAFGGGFFTPGLIFGIVLACYFGIVQARDLTYSYRIPFFIAMSWLAYYVAVQTAISLGLDKNTNLPFPSSMFIAGCVGALILGLGFWAIQRWQWFETKYFVGLIVLGGILGLTFFLGKSFNQSFPSLVSAIGFKNGDDFGFLTLYIIWQTGTAFYLGYLLDGAKET